MTDVLDLFSDTATLLTAEDIAERLAVSRPTAFRYARELSEAGFLANFSGRYTLGARIITLDYRIRQSDPILKAAVEPIAHLAAQTRCSVVLCRMYNDEVVHVHQVRSADPVAILDRGRPLPLFRGAASKVMLAFMSPARLKKLCERHLDDPQLRRLGADWPAWRRHFAAIRRDGHYVSQREVDEGVNGIAAPVLMPGGAAPASISLVYSSARTRLPPQADLVAQVMACADIVSASLAPLTPPEPA